MAAETTTTAAPARHRPKSFTVFAAAFIAGAAAAVGVNRVLDVQLAQRRPQVECEPIFVALRALPQGAPVTVWDVALKDWPKAMLPSSALRAGDTFEGAVLRHAVREGQPLLAVQLVRSGGPAAATVAADVYSAPAPAAPLQPEAGSTQADPWMPSEQVGQPAAVPAPVAAAPIPAVAPPPQPEPETLAPPMPQSTGIASVAEPPPSTTDAEPTTQPTPAEETPTPPVAATGQPMPPSPTDIDPPAAPGPTIAGSSNTASDDSMAESVATDVQSMPSVMTDHGQPVAQGSRPAPADAGRYLVVPERIALQADTSFTTPRPEPPGPPATPPTRPVTTSSRQPTATQPAATRGQAARPQAGRSAAPVQQQQGQQPQQRGTPASAPRAAATPRPWGGMFPNVAAGIEAMGGSWQRRSSTQPPAPAVPHTRR